MECYILESEILGWKATFRIEITWFAPMLQMKSLRLRIGKWFYAGRTAVTDGANGEPSTLN